VRRGIGLTGQYAALDESLTGWANLVMIGQLSRLRGKAARWRADQMLALRPDQRLAGGPDLLGRHAAALGPSRRPDRRPVGAVPRRADHRPGPQRPRDDLPSPISRWTVLTARTLAELVTQMISAVVATCVGLAIGWRVHTRAIDVIAAFALALLVGYAFTWAEVCLGLTPRSPEAAQQAGLVIFLPLTFISSAFVPAQGMPGLAAADRRVEPDVRARLDLPAPVRQPGPGRGGARLAHAAPRTRRVLLVRGHAGRLRAAGRAPVPPQGAQLSQAAVRTAREVNFLIPNG
jgi:hypothetical protein